MKDYGVYMQGYAAGLADKDDRSCPYQGHDNENDWLDGWYQGQADRTKKKK